MDENLKQQFDHLCNKLGLNMSTAFNIFARTMVRQQKISFKISLDIPNAETLAAIDDVNHERNLRRSFHSVAELMADLNSLLPFVLMNLNTDNFTNCRLKSKLAVIQSEW